MEQKVVSLELYIVSIQENIAELTKKKEEMSKKSENSVNSLNETKRLIASCRKTVKQVKLLEEEMKQLQEPMEIETLPDEAYPVQFISEKLKKEIQRILSKSPSTNSKSEEVTLDKDEKQENDYLRTSNFMIQTGTDILNFDISENVDTKEEYTEKLIRPTIDMATPLEIWALPIEQKILEQKIENLTPRTRQSRHKKTDSRCCHACL